MNASENNNLANQIPVNPNHVKASETIAEAADENAATSKIFKDILGNIPVFLNPQLSASGWVMVETLVDGKKVMQAVQVVSQNNAVMANFFTLEELANFIQHAQGMFQALRNEVMKSMPIIVASPDQMQQAVQSKQHMDGKFGSQPVNWPPKDGKFSL